MPNVQRAHELAPGDPKPLAKLIALQKKLGLLDEAVANHLKLAALYDRLEQPVPANAERVKAVTIAPGLVTVQREIADWYLARDNTKKAVARLLILAEHFRAQGDMPGMRAELERALAINPQHPKAIQMMEALEARIAVD